MEIRIFSEDFEKKNANFQMVKLCSYLGFAEKMQKEKVNQNKKNPNGGLLSLMVISHPKKSPKFWLSEFNGENIIPWLIQKTSVSKYPRVGSGIPVFSARN